MWKNLIVFMVGAMAFALLFNKPGVAEDRDYAHVLIATSSKELAIFNRTYGKIYYYDKLSGKFLRSHTITELGKNLSKK